MAEFAKVFRIEMSGGKDVEQDILSMKKQMASYSAEIKKAKKLLDDLLSSKGGADSGAVTKLKGRIAELESQIVSLNEKRQQATDSAGKESAATTQLADDTKKQTGEYIKLNQQYKEAKTNAQNLAAQYGAESDQAIEAAKSAGLLQEKIKGINDLVKNGGVKVEIPVVPTVVDTPKTTTAKQTVSDVDKAKAKLADSASDDAKEIAKLNAQTIENNKQNKAAALEALGLTDAYKKLEKEYQVAARAAKNIGVEQGEQSDAFKASAAEAKKLSDRLKEIDQAVGQSFRNVGNYTESFSILEKALQDTTNKINTLKSAQREAAGGQGSGPRSGEAPNVRAAANDDLTQLTKQQQALQQVVNNTARGFTNLTQEMKVNERGLQTMRAVGLQDTDAFRALQKQTNETRKSFNDFAKSQKILSSDLPAITGLTIAARGLAGTYALGAGAAALFGDEQGKIEKEVQKLVAIMTVLNGLQEAHELLEQKDAIATALAAAAQKVYAFVVGQSTGALAAFRIALAATGLGLFVIAIGYLITNWKELFKVTDPVIKQLDNMKGVSKEAKDALKEYGNTAKEISKGLIKDLKEGQKSLNDELGLTPTLAEKTELQLKVLTERLAILTKQNADLKKTGNFLDERTAATYATNADEIESINDQIIALNQNLDPTASKLERIARINFGKAVGQAAIEAFKLAQDANNRELQLQATSLGKRLQLTKQNFELEKLVIQHAYEDEQVLAGKDRAKQTEATTKFNNSNLVALRNYEDSKSALIRQYAIRDENAQSQINERRLQAAIDSNKKIASNEIVKYGDQLAASKKALEGELSLNRDMRRHELTEEGLTRKERNNIRDKYRVADLKAQEEFTLRNQDIDKREFERQNKELKNTLDERVALIQENNAKIQNNPTISNVAKAQAQVEADNQILDEEQIYYDSLLKLNDNYNKEALSQAKVALANKRKAVDGDRKLLFDGEIKDILDATGILNDKAKEKLSQATIDILSSELSPRQQAQALIELQRNTQDELLKIQVESLRKQVAEKKKALEEQQISQKEYNDTVADLAEAEAKLFERKTQREKTALQRAKDAMKDFVVGFVENVLKIKTYADDEVGHAQRQADAQDAIFQSINNTISKTAELYRAAEENQIESQKKRTLDFIDRQEQRVLAQAQSEEERETIQRKFDKKREDAEKAAAKKKKQLALKQAAVDFALGVIQTIAQYKLPILWAPIVAFMTVGYLLQRAIISQQQFAKGGKVNAKPVGNGLIKSSGNIPAQKNGDNILATVKTGEVVLNKQQQQALGGAKLFKSIGVPGFAAGGRTGALGSNLTAPVFSGREFLNGSSPSSSKIEDQITELKNLQVQVLEAVYSTDAKEVVLDPHKVTKAQEKRKRDVLIGSLKK